MDHASLCTLRERHPAWRLLASPHAPLVAGFLHRVFVAPNVRVMRSFRAFWDFLMSSRRQEGLSERLDQVLALPAVVALRPF